MDNYNDRFFKYQLTCKGVLMGVRAFAKSNASDRVINCQFGFRKKHSTNVAITFLCETILEVCDTNKSVCGMFLDFAKAFDCVNHKILRDKLEHYDVRGVTRSLFCSYLTCRIGCNIL